MLNRISIIALGALFALGLAGPIAVHAATPPDLGQAASFVILSSTYTNTVGGTTLTGDLGYTTGPAVAPTVNGSTFSPPSSKYSTAGTDQASALANLNAQLPCTFSYASGAIDLASDVTTPDGVGQFTPGIYCITGAASIGGGGTITLTGAGTYIFRMTGALTTSAGSIVAVAGGASACNVFWTPGEATTLGANTTFKGTVIDAAGITIGSTVGWVGRALAFGGTVSTASDTISSTSCTAATALATLHVIKTVTNDNDGTSAVADFNLYVKLSGSNVSGSPAVGVASPGRSYSLSAGTYVVSEDEDSAYNQSFSGACNSSGSVTLAAGETKTCTITNNDISPTIKVTKEASKTTLEGSADVTFTYRVTNKGDVPLSDVSVKDDRCDDEEYVSGDDNGDDLLDTTEEWKYTCKKTVRKTETNTVTAKGTANGEEVKSTDTAKVTVSTPGLPKAGVGPADEENNFWSNMVRQLSSLFAFHE